MDRPQIWKYANRQNNMIQAFEIKEIYLLGGWWETCSATKVSWFFVHQGTGPSVTREDESAGRPGISQWHLNTSPRMGLYGFLATEDFLPAWYADKYHRTTCTIRSLGSAKSAILKRAYNHTIKDTVDTWRDHWYDCFLSSWFLYNKKWELL